ncbi:Predicted house-cleaning noncanonical NTP pyrophosphatase, all-alpha NTP-PPase (MazG) superfamily [Celeribacter neptunius]|uniref:Predicted house-cleaning noncanonical NTP pyrophosphatase, all-alpha NTP-PPase (MazG) superfamily n=2 Tax=Celeribacter neptunius TaxID=588602 RepID=A0A1I3XUJ7_9RHOB|nr:Predicted house-cleaning noncanonical NTP pyrophosphatase, all-alpha NTP-PPase (MazG) superfamily [Celeribacter neptunius]
MEQPDLLDFLENRMSMTDVYQPVILKELLLNGGESTKSQLATALAGHDLAVQEYYERVVMRWPKKTLTKHGMVEYERKGSRFRLLTYPTNQADFDQAVAICDEKITGWFERKMTRERAHEAGASIRYEVLKLAGGKCQLCGISSQVRPIDIDHIVPRSKANKDGKVKMNGKLIDVNDRQNLQALCFSCNRAKRNQDNTDFRRRNTLIRDNVATCHQDARQGPELKKLEREVLISALYEKLEIDYLSLMQTKETHLRQEKLADVIELAFALGGQSGINRESLLQLVEQKRRKFGGYEKGYFGPGSLAAQ